MTSGKRWADRFFAAGVGVAATIAATAALRFASKLPARDTGDVSVSVRHRRDQEQSALEKGVSRLTAKHPNVSGVHFLNDGIDAFAARLLLTRVAQHRIDVQYYIWHGDKTGTLFLEALYEAAQRGVHVRLLLDDNGIAGLDHILAALNQHPLIEVRLFNPFRIRYPKSIGFVVDFARLNRRMHNKSFTVDGAATIVGGRNIGDEYFEAGDGALFADLDVLAIGPVVHDVEVDFERYWNSKSVYPAEQIFRKVCKDQLEKLQTRASIVEREPAARRYIERLRSLPLITDLIAGKLDLEWAFVQMISDDPAKGLGDVDYENLLAGQLDNTIGDPVKEIGIISGYFVPGADGTKMLCELAQSGIDVKILTNGYAATDVAVVHSGYAPWRKALLQAGVSLFETSPEVRDTLTRKERRKGKRLGVGSRLSASGSGSFAALRSGASTIHAKTFTVDRERLFVGSFNFDPRSVKLNTEIGFVIHSKVLAGQIADAFDTLIPASAYSVRLAYDGHLRWDLDLGPTTISQKLEPGMRLRDKLLIAIAARLPIDWLL